ncbi:hypothetical protein DFH06DRAFT_308199 [Mycena polygramma]|nr:hypothetical protein DFH06DRAFT_308199 [Mycena polygramma]
MSGLYRALRQVWLLPLTLLFRRILANPNFPPLILTRSYHNQIRIQPQLMSTRGQTRQMQPAAFLVKPLFPPILRPGLLVVRGDSHLSIVKDGCSDPRSQGARSFAIHRVLYQEHKGATGHGFHSYAKRAYYDRFSSKL